MTLTWVQLKEYTQVSARKNTSWQIPYRDVQSGIDKWNECLGAVASDSNVGIHSSSRLAEIPNGTIAVRFRFVCLQNRFAFDKLLTLRSSAEIASGFLCGETSQLNASARDFVRQTSIPR